MNSILYFRSASKTDASAEKLIGIREIAAKLGWHVQVLDIALTAQTKRELIGFWNPCGVIVECGERASIGRLLDDFGGLPVVYIDRDPDELPSSVSRFFVLHDSVEAGRTAARELMVTGFDSFAFVPFPGRWRWSRERQQGFEEALALNGFACSVFRTKETELGSPAYMHDLKRFLSRVRRPCAVFVANDDPAEKVLSAARLLGISVPSGLAVLGVDDYAALCEHTRPRLSSVKPNFRRGGNLAALLLAAAVRDGKKFRGSRIVRYGTLRCVRRESVGHLLRTNDREAAAALEYIHNEACNGLQAADVLKRFSCSRPLAAARFKAATGRTALEEIHAVQLERVKEMLLHDNCELKTISDFCGFANPNSLRKFFRRETGQTMSAWRAAHLSRRR